VLKKRRVGERSVCKLMVPILKGLKAVHEQKFLRRDIKPGNIFIRREGPSLLIDLGAARPALQQKAASAMTVILTPGYAPLEQFGESEDQQGPWTDLYAFGATLFHCLTGRPPRDAAWRIQASAHVVPDPIREALNPSTPLCSAAKL
jgi:serine/threonine protein kinase